MGTEYFLLISDSISRALMSPIPVNESPLERLALRYEDLKISGMRYLSDNPVKRSATVSTSSSDSTTHGPAISKKLSELLENAIRKYQNNLLTAAQVIDELIRLAKDIRASDARGSQLKLTDEELAFYDALAANDSAKDVLGDKTLRDLARVLVDRVKSNTSIDWTIKESVRAKLRVIVRRLLRQYGYPPDMQLLATENVLKQAELLADDWDKTNR